MQGLSIYRDGSRSGVMISVKNEKKTAGTSLQKVPK